MKMRFQITQIAPDPTQYKKFLVDYAVDVPIPGDPDNRWRNAFVELDVPDDLVYVDDGDYVLTEAGMVYVLAKLGKIAKDAEQMFYQLDKGE